METYHLIHDKLILIKFLKITFFVHVYCTSVGTRKTRNEIKWAIICFLFLSFSCCRQHWRSALFSTLQRTPWLKKAGKQRKPSPNGWSKKRRIHRKRTSSTWKNLRRRHEVENDKMNHVFLLIDRSLVVIHICNKNMRARMQVVIGG